MSTVHPPLVRTRLSILMFLEFFIWGGWGFALAGYAENLGFSGAQTGWLMAIPAVGAIVSPLFMGLIADRLFAAQWLLALLHLLGGACLLAARYQTSFPGLMTCMMLNGLCFMPTIALANSVAFRHIPDPDKFPRIAVLGTIGWILAVLVASVLLGGMKSPSFLTQSGIAGIVLGFYCLTLPHTPPKGSQGSGDAFGLSALKLLKEPSFLIFIICVGLFSIPACSYFFTLIGPMLQQRDYPAPLALTTLCQFSEIIFMFSMPWFITKLGLKRVIAIGMFAWAVRYLCFASPAFSLALLGLVLHGFCYSFFYVGAYMYIDKRAPEDLKASAQSLMAFLLLGVGFFLGAQVAGQMKDRFSPDISGMTALDVETAETLTDAKLPNWDDPNAADSAWRYLDLSATVSQLLSKEDEPQAAVSEDLATQLDANADGRITLGEIDAAPGSNIEIDGFRYSKKDLTFVFQQIAKNLDGSAEKEIALTRPQWLEAQTAKWRPIWVYPAIFAFLILGVFLIGFRDKVPESQDDVLEERSIEGSFEE